MSNLASVSFRIDSDLKYQAENLFKELGLTMTTAFNIFLKQSVRQGKIPFEIALNSPNETTIKSLENVRNNIGLSKEFYSVKDLMEDLNADY